METQRRWHAPSIGATCEVAEPIERVFRSTDSKTCRRQVCDNNMAGRDLHNPSDPCAPSPDAKIPWISQIKGHRPPENDSSYRRFPRQIPRMPPGLHSKSARGGAHRWRLLHAAPLQARFSTTVIRTVWQPGSASTAPFPDALKGAATECFGRCAGALADRTWTACESRFDRLFAADVGRTGCHLYVKHRFSQATREPRSSSPILPRPHSVPCHSWRV